MNALDRQRFRLAHDQARQLATAAIWRAPEGWTVEIKPPNRSLDQNARLHAILSDIVASKIEVGGKRRTIDEWKFLMVVAHAHETETPVELVEFEGQRIALRESTASMSKARSSSLIDFVTAWAVSHGVKLREVADARP